MMARIEAGERLRGISDGAIAAGNMGPFEARRMMSRLEETARGHSIKAERASPAVLAAMGIGVVSAPPPASQKDERGG